jgi:hypothetical protein
MNQSKHRQWVILNEAQPSEESLTDFTRNSRFLTDVETHLLSNFNVISLLESFRPGRFVEEISICP